VFRRGGGGVQVAVCLDRAEGGKGGEGPTSDGGERGVRSEKQLPDVSGPTRPWEGGAFPSSICKRGHDPVYKEGSRTGP